MRDDFAIFILTHGRPHKQRTLSSLKNSNYTGKIFLLIDNEDPTAGEYFDLYGDQVIQFDKEAVGQTFDPGDTFNIRATITFARNAVQQIAKDLGLKYVLQLDDDYNNFSYRYLFNDVICSRTCRSFDDVVEAYIELLEDTGAVTVAMSQGGDHIGGIGGRLRRGLLRKAMNAFFFKVDNMPTFIGSMNEDVNTYVTLSSRGNLFLTTLRFQLTQTATQSESGGITDTYQKFGTYTKSFYTVMMHPSSVRVMEMGDRVSRMHHKINWEATAPKIISGKHKKVKQ
jgi:hypothetical protein